MKKQPYYDVEFTIDGKDHTPNVQSVRIINSIFAVFQTVMVEFRIDSQDVVSQEIYGQKPVKLIIRLMTDDKQEKDQYEIEIYTLYVMGSKPQKPQNERQHPLSNRVTLIGVPKQPWDYMTTPVNYLSKNTNPKSPYDVVNDMIDKYLVGVKKDIVDKNKNSYAGEQIPIPPMNFACAVDYLNERYSIFKGPLFYQCIFEENTLSMWDLGRKIDEPEVLKIYTLAHGKKEKPEIYENSGRDDKTFYTYSNVIFKTRSNVLAAGENYEHNFIMKPRDQLYNTRTVNAKKIYDTFLPKDGGGEWLIHDDLKKQNKRWYGRSFVGVDLNEALITSKMASKFLIQSEAKIRLDRNIRLKNLFKVGVPVKLQAETANYMRYHGKYLIKGTAITLTRDTSSHYKGIADVHVFRSNVLLT